MKNINLDILFNIANKNNFSSNLESIQNKVPDNYVLKNLKNIPVTTFMKQSLTKFHRPQTSKMKSKSINKYSYSNDNNIDLYKSIPFFYNNGVKKDRNLVDMHILNNEYNSNLLNATKIDFHKKINGKHIDDLLIKHIISLPEIKEENNFTQKSISIMNQNREKPAKLDNTKNQIFANRINKNQIFKNNSNNIKIFANDSNRQNNYKINNRYNVEEKNNDKNINNYANNAYQIKDNNSYEHSANIMLLKSLENRLKKDQLSSMNSNQSLIKSTNESKNNSNIAFNNILKYGEIKVQNEIKGITNIIITNQKIIPERFHISNNQSKLYDSNEQLNNSKINIDKIIPPKNIYIQKYNTSKEKELIKLPNLKYLYYLIFPGNASYLVEKCMKHRVNWVKPFSVVSTLFNFKWQELSIGIDYHSLGYFHNVKQLVNHFENHYVISNKAKMFINLLNYCERRNLSVFKFVPFTIIFNLRDENKNKEDNENKKSTIEATNKYEKLKEMINSVEKYVKNFEEIGQFYRNENFQKYMNYLRYKESKGDYRNVNYNDYKKLFKRKNLFLRRHKKRNALSNTTKKKDGDTNKENDIKVEGYTLYSDFFNNLVDENKMPIYDKNKEKMYEEENKKMSNRYANNNDEKSIIGVNTCIEIPKTHFSGKNLWIVKAINLNRGMCIKIVNSYEQMLQVINKFKEGVDYNFTKQKLEENNNEINLENQPEQKLNKSSSNKNKSLSNRVVRKNLSSADKTKTITINKDYILNKNKVRIINKNNMNSAIRNLKTKTVTEENYSVELKKNKKEEEKKINDIKDKEKEKKEEKYMCNKIIIQKYIENPLLYKGRKFDMRIWVLLTHTMKVYVFKEGHLKTCSIEYSLNSKDAFAHITNYSFQKYNTYFQRYEKGNEVPFFEFQNFLNETYAEKNYNIKNNLIPQIKEIIKITMRSVKYKINKKRRNYQFEIFGYDFMMDKDFNLFLIEINTNPGLEESSPWIKIIVPRMLDDALRLTIDQLFETKYDFDVIKKNRTKEEDDAYDYILYNYNKMTKNNEAQNIKENIVEDNNEKNNNEKDNDEKNNKQGDDLDKKLENKLEENKIINNQTKNKINDNKEKKYISPYPVPGYSLEENIWDFVCDLDDPDPLDELKEKEEKNKVQENEKVKIINGHKYHLSKSSKKRKKIS